MELRVRGRLCARHCARPPHASRPRAAPRATCPARRGMGPGGEPQASPGCSASGELFKVRVPGPPQTSCIGVPYPLPSGERSHLSWVRAPAHGTAQAQLQVVSCFLNCAPTVCLALCRLLEEPGVVQPLSSGNMQQLREPGPHTGLRTDGTLGAVRRQPRMAPSLLAWATSHSSLQESFLKGPQN